MELLHVKNVSIIFQRLTLSPSLTLISLCRMSKNCSTDHDARYWCPLTWHQCVAMSRVSKACWKHWVITVGTTFCKLIVIPFFAEMKQKYRTIVCVIQDLIWDRIIYSDDVQDVGYSQIFWLWQSKDLILQCCALVTCQPLSGYHVWQQLVKNGR